jgi:putative membrane protein
MSRNCHSTLALAAVTLLVVSLTAIAADDKKEFDSVFIKDSAQRIQGELELSRLVDSHSRSDGVKHYADLQIKHYRDLLDEIRKLADEQSVKLPTDIGDHQKDSKKRLEEAKSTEFDLQYLSDQLDEQQTLIDLFTRGSKDCQEKKLRDFASKNINDLKDRLANAKELYGKIKEKDKG